MKQKREPKETIRKLINKNLFSAKVMIPEVKMKMVESIVGIHKPRAISDAERLAKEEKILI